MLTRILLVISCFIFGALSQAEIVKKTLEIPDNLRNQLITNGGFEQSTGKLAKGWGGWRQGYEVDNKVSHSGNNSARCTNTDPDQHSGCTYVVELNQTEPLPIVAECWSKAENVSGRSNADFSHYSLYLDIVYTDETTLWGQIARFKPGTQDWTKRQVTIVPAKPIKLVSVHGIFRMHTGTVWFDDFSLYQLDVPAGMTSFDTIPVAEVTQPDRVFTDYSGNGLPFGLYVRDFEAKSSFVQPEYNIKLSEDGFVNLTGTDEALGLALEATCSQIPDGIRVDGVVKDLRGTNRAVSVYMGTPVDATGWQWHTDQRVSRSIEDRGSYNEWVSIGAGSNRSASRYPLACISSADESLVIGSPLTVPRLYRYGYAADCDELYAVADLGISPDTSRFPSQASFSFILYRSDPAWGFRSALQKYYSLFPECFTKRNEKEGIWMPFVDIAKIPKWEDFGFQFQEGAPNVAWDEEHGIYSFPYVEPMSYWMAMPKEMERTREAAFAMLNEQVAAGDAQARATVNSIMEDVDGEMTGEVQNAPWCDGAMFSLSPAPGIKDTEPEAPTKFRLDYNSIQNFINRPTMQINSWGVYDSGFKFEETGHNGGVAARLERTAATIGSTGLAQRIILNQTEAKPLIARVWTKSQDISGEPGIGYSLWVDLTYTDGTYGYGFQKSAPTGTHDWVLLEMPINPDKPVASANFHMLLRPPFTGIAWFDDAELVDAADGINLAKNGNFESKETEEAVPFVDGVYFDSFEMASTTLNYRREHFKTTDTPLVFDADGRVAQMCIFNTVEYVRKFAQNMWPNGRMTFANATPWNFPWGAAWLDVMGTETNWAPEGKWTPANDDIMNYRRAICYQRPYLLLQNTVFDDFPYEFTEKYLKRCLAYDIFPSFFSHNAATEIYWERPNLFERDRPLFIKYMPVFKALGSAGWEPLTYAWSNEAKIYVERFGGLGKPLYFTFFNDSTKPLTATIMLGGGELGLPNGEITLQDTLSDWTETVYMNDGTAVFEITLEPEDVRVITVK